MDNDLGKREQLNIYKEYYTLLSKKSSKNMRGKENALTMTIDGNEMMVIFFKPEPKSDYATFGLFLANHRYSRKTLDIRSNGEIAEDTVGIITESDCAKKEPKFTSSNEQIVTIVMNEFKKKLAEKGRTTEKKSKQKIKKITTPIAEKVEDIISVSPIGKSSEISLETMDMNKNLINFLGTGYTITTHNKAHAADFERICINKLGSDHKEIDIAIVGDNANIIITPENADYCYTGSFKLTKGIQIGKIVDKFFETGECSEKDGMTKKPWHTKENSYNAEDEELADMIGLSDKEKYVRLRMDQEEKDILVDLNNEAKVAERLPTSKVRAILNDEEKAVWLPAENKELIEEIVQQLKDELGERFEVTISPEEEKIKRIHIKESEKYLMHPTSGDPGTEKLLIAMQKAEAIIIFQAGEKINLSLSAHPAADWYHTGTFALSEIKKISTIIDKFVTTRDIVEEDGMKKISLNKEEQNNILD